jgi:dCMP deaminase
MSAKICEGGPVDAPHDWEPDEVRGGHKCRSCGVWRWTEKEKKRPTHEQLNMRYAELLAQRSTCSRLQVGCVIASADFHKVISMGYNGNAAGLHNGCDSKEPGACGCLHAEDNAVINCDSPRGTPKIVFCTHLPCKMCAKRFVNLGDVRKVYYQHEYRVLDGLYVLSDAGIDYQQMESSW